MTDRLGPVSTGSVLGRGIAACMMDGNSDVERIKRFFLDNTGFKVVKVKVNADGVLELKARPKRT